MPNIELHGYRDPRAISGKVWGVIQSKFKKKLDDVVITTSPSEVRSLKSDHRPFIRVISNDKKIAPTLHKDLNLDVEWIRLAGFFEAKT